MTTPNRVWPTLGRPSAVIMMLIALWSSNASAESAAAKARSFVGKTYFHGAPYGEAKALGPTALPELERMLADPSQKSQWRTIIATIAYIGAPQSFHILKTFMWTRFKGSVDNDTWKALLAVPNVMGAIPDSPEAPVIQYLEQGTNPAFWDSLPWTESYHEQRGDLSIMLSKVSINGLACTGTAHAAKVLEQLKEKPYSQRQIPNIDEGLQVNREVQTNGFGAYLESLRQELANPPQKAGVK